MEQKQLTIGVCGLWHLGSVLAASWVTFGASVIGYDADAQVVAGLQRGRAPLFEPELDNAISQACSTGKLRFTSELCDLSDCDVIFFAWDTPVADDDTSDISDILAIARAVAQWSNNALIVISSQVPAGSTRVIEALMREINPAVSCVYSPENLRLGVALACYQQPGRIIIGCDDDTSRERAIALFSRIPASLVTMDTVSAEVVKHGINSFLATSITFANHLADICELTGAQVSAVIEGLKSDPRIGEKAYLSPGIGFSGGTLGRDLQVLSQINAKKEGSAPLFEAVFSWNAQRGEAITQKILNYYSQYGCRNIGFLGVTYKPGTSTLRRSLPLQIAQNLPSDIPLSVFDPLADFTEYTGAQTFTRMSSAHDLICKADLIVICTEWPEFAELDWGSCVRPTRPQVVFDTKYFLKNVNLAQIGYTYCVLGNG